MTDLDSGRGWLNDAPAASIRRIDRALGHPLQITEAGRTWAQQNAHWLNYQRNGRPIALHPDTPSVHQKGAAIDTDEGQNHVGMLAEHGWKRTVYRWVNGHYTLVEPWHFEYVSGNDKHRFDGEPASNTTTPTTASPQEDDMIAARITDGRGVQHHAIIGNGHLRHLIDADDLEWQKNITTSDDRWTDIPIQRLPSVLRTFACDLHIWDIRDGSFVVLDPLTGNVSAGALWSATNAARSSVEGVKITSEETRAYVEQLAKER